MPSAADKPTLKLASYIIAGVLGVIFLIVAAHKPLWNDEQYSQISSVRGMSYEDMFWGNINEGSNPPLFYMVQKVFQTISGYVTPKEWLNGDWKYNDPYSNVLLRFWPAFCVAGGIAMIFYYFSFHYGIWTGIYSLLVSLSSFMPWLYAVEARPYALWFFLTSAQMVLVLMGGRIFNLSFVNTLLAFTTIFSVIQNFAAAMCLWINGQRRLLTYIPVFFIPVFIALFYYANVEKPPLGMIDTFMELLGASLPVDRMVIIGLALAWCFLVHREDRKFWQPVVFTAIVLAGCLAVLIKFKISARPMGGCYVSNRYFMVLAPVGIIMTTIASHYLVTRTKGLMQKGMFVLLAALLLARIYKTYKLVILGHLMMVFPGYGR